VHPILIDLYAQERHAAMLRTAEKWRVARERRDRSVHHGADAQRRPPGLRERLGWLLVVAGLRLAVGPAAIAASRARPGAR
jgi:hypothetical protein